MQVARRPRDIDNRRPDIRLLRVIATLDPTSGGPSAATTASCIALQALGHRPEILTLDAASEGFPGVGDVPVHPIGPAFGKYRYCPALVPWLRQNATRFDAVVVEGLWQYHGLAIWHALKRGSPPYFVFSHGMLDPWFKRHYPLKHVKKSLYWNLVEHRILRGARALCFTSEEERLQARQSFADYDVRELVVPYGSEHPPPDPDRLRSVFLAAHPALRGQRLWLFLGRLHEKKGCDLLVSAFAALAGSYPEAQLVMAGPDQGSIRAELESLARRHRIDSRITWTGMLSGDLKWGALYASDVFILPSHQENFGIAVTEALSCGVPVLISDKVNIWREVKTSGAGLIAPDTLDGTTDLLRRWCTLGEDASRAMRRGARTCFEQRFTPEATAKGLSAALAQVIEAAGAELRVAPAD